MRWLGLIAVLPFASALALVLFGSRVSRGPAATVWGVLLLFLLAVPATIAVVVAVVRKVFRRFKPLAVGGMRG
jgi:NADH:ubiquinone oxidoreductase subunit K